MQTRRTATPVPGFPHPTNGAGPEATSSRPGSRDGPTAAERVYPSAPRRALSVRVSADLLDRYVALLGALRGERLETSLTEVVHALMYAGPTSEDELRELVRQWRRVRDADQ
jgi:hypothetical protein